MLHSGSRNIGYKIADYYIKKAKELMPTGLPDKDLAYFTSDQDEYHEYMRDMQWAQLYAAENRQAMMQSFLEELEKTFDIKGEEWISCHHNFAQTEEHFGKELVVVRKGAIEAQKGQAGIIPGAMGVDSYIVRGEGAELSLNSAPHGAGRKMSRSKAKKTFTQEQLETSLDGIVAKKDKSVLDEIALSYKDINSVIEASSDLVRPVAKLNQLMCIKG
jgi:tRNA-splicing ligase RtcB